MKRNGKKWRPSIGTYTWLPYMTPGSLHVSLSQRKRCSASEKSLWEISRLPIQSRRHSALRSSQRPSSEHPSLHLGSRLWGQQSQQSRRVPLTRAKATQRPSKAFKHLTSLEFIRILSTEWDEVSTKCLVDTHGRHQAKERTQNTSRCPGSKKLLQLTTSFYQNFNELQVTGALLASGERQVPSG